LWCTRVELSSIWDRRRWGVWCAFREGVIVVFGVFSCCVNGCTVFALSVVVCFAWLILGSGLRRTSLRCLGGWVWVTGLFFCVWLSSRARCTGFLGHGWPQAGTPAQVRDDGAASSRVGVAVGAKHACMDARSVLPGWQQMRRSRNYGAGNRRETEEYHNAAAWMPPQLVQTASTTTSGGLCATRKDWFELSAVCTEALAWMP